MLQTLTLIREYRPLSKFSKRYHSSEYSKRYHSNEILQKLPQIEENRPLSIQKHKFRYKIEFLSGNL